jgi:CRP-like cAMP-binding protein
MRQTSLSPEDLLDTTLFQGLNLDQAGRALQASRKRRVADGAYFFMEGDPAERVFVLLQGKAKLIQITPEGQQVNLGYASAGQELGMVAVLDDFLYPVSVQAVGDCQALAWEREDMLGLMEGAPRIARNALRILSRHMHAFQDRIRELSTQRVERRIARALLRLAQQTGRKIEDGVLIDLPLTRQDLAEMTATTLYTVSRTLKKWENQGLIQSKRERVVICSPHGLVSIAEDLNDN